MTAYLFIIGFASLGHYFLPYPQEAVFATCGYAAAHFGLSFWGALAACLAASLAGDLAVFWAARGGGRLLKRLMRSFPAEDLARVRARLGHRTLASIITLRLFPLTRLLVTLAAGLADVPARTFILADAITLALLAPLFFLLGDRSYAAVMRYLEGPNRLLPWLALLAVSAAGYATYALVARRRRLDTKRQLD